MAWKRHASFMSVPAACRHHIKHPSYQDFLCVLSLSEMHPSEMLRGKQHCQGNNTSSHISQIAVFACCPHRTDSTHQVAKSLWDLQNIPHPPIRLDSEHRMSAEIWLWKRMISICQGACRVISLHFTPNIEININHELKTPLPRPQAKNSNINMLWLVLLQCSDFKWLNDYSQTFLGVTFRPWQPSWDQSLGSAVWPVRWGRPLRAATKKRVSASSKWPWTSPTASLGQKRKKKHRRERPLRVATHDNNVASSKKANCFIKLIAKEDEYDDEGCCELPHKKKVSERSQKPWASPIAWMRRRPKQTQSRTIGRSCKLPWKKMATAISKRLWTRPIPDPSQQEKKTPHTLGSLTYPG